MLESLDIETRGNKPSKQHKKGTDQTEQVDLHFCSIKAGFLMMRLNLYHKECSKQNAQNKLAQAHVAILHNH